MLNKLLISQAQVVFRNIWFLPILAILFILCATIFPVVCFPMLFSILYIYLFSGWDMEHRIFTKKLSIGFSRLEIALSEHISAVLVSGISGLLTCVICILRNSDLWVLGIPLYTAAITSLLITVNMILQNTVLSAAIPSGLLILYVFKREERVNLMTNCQTPLMLISLIVILFGPIFSWLIISRRDFY